MYELMLLSFLLLPHLLAAIIMSKIDNSCHFDDSAMPYPLYYME